MLTTSGSTRSNVLLGSQAEHVQASIYELPSVLDEKFDIVLFMGVLYHLRHPLLALDNVRRLTRTHGLHRVGGLRHGASRPEPRTSIARFYRGDSLGNDPSNWFAPNLLTLNDWCESCGLEVQSCQRLA